MFDLNALIQLLFTKFPVIATILVIVGGLRLLFKPTFALLQQIADFTYWTDADNKALAKVQASKVMKTILFVLDWFASIKIPQKQ